MTELLHEDANRPTPFTRYAVLLYRAMVPRIARLARPRRKP